MKPPKYDFLRHELRKASKRVDVAIRSLWARKIIIVADQHLPWLGLSYPRLEAILIKNRIRAVPLSSIKLDSPIGSIEICSDQVCQKLALYPALVELEECRLSDTPSFEKVLSKWSYKIQISITNITSSILSAKACGVVLVQGYEPNNASLRAAALLQGIPCLALENTSRPDRLVWDNIAAFACIDNLSRNFYFQNKSFVPVDVVRDYRRVFLTQYVHVKSDEHRSGSHTNAHSFETLPNDFVLFIGQVFTDAATLNCLNDWKSPLELMEAVANWCISNNTPLVIKLHPKEQIGHDTVTGNPYSNLTLRKLLESSSLKGKLDQCSLYIDTANICNTYELIKASSVAVTLSSQAGLEAAMFGKPVVVGGRSIYSGLGFTYDASSPWLLDTQMNQAFANKDIDHSFEASLFAYIFFEKYCISKTEECLADLCLSMFGR